MEWVKLLDLRAKASKSQCVVQSYWKGAYWKEEKPTCYILVREKAQLAQRGLKQTHPIISGAGVFNCPSGF